MSVYCIRNSSSFSRLDLSPSCHPLTLQLPSLSIIGVRLSNVSEIRKEGVRENTTMEEYRIHSPTHFPPFLPRLEVSEARTSCPFPSSPPVFTDGTRGDPGHVSSQCRGIAATEIAGRSWSTGREPWQEPKSLGLRRGRDTIPQGNSKAGRGE